MSTIKNELLTKRLEDLMNSISRENESNTPDFLLADYLVNCLEIFDQTIKSRDAWYGVHLEPGNKYFVKKLDPEVLKKHEDLLRGKK